MLIKVEIFIQNREKIQLDFFSHFSIYNINIGYKNLTDTFIKYQNLDFPKKLNTILYYFLYKSFMFSNCPKNI